MKSKMFILMFCIILLISMSGFISSFEFDNVKNYDFTKKEVTIKNSFLGIPTTTVATITLNTPNIVWVGVGKDKMVAEFTINLNDEDYSDALKKLDFYKTNKNKRLGSQFTRDFVYKKKIITGQKEINDYEIACTTSQELINSSYEKCNNEIVGSHYEDVYGYEELNNDDLNKGVITIGIFMEVYEGDYVEWIPTFFGVEIQEWAIFGAVITDPTDITFDITTPGQTLKHGMGFVTNFSLILTRITKDPLSTTTKAYILNSTFDVIANSTFIGDNATFNIHLNGSEKFYAISDSGGGTYDRRSKVISVFPQRTNINYTSGLSNDNTEVFNAAFNIISIDTKREEMNVILNSPANNTNFSSKNIQFNCSSTVFGGTTLQNISLLHNATGTLENNQTTSVSGTTNTTIFNITFENDGNYIWTCSAVNSNNEEDSAIENRTLTIDTTAPIINLTFPTGIINFHKLNNNLTINWSIDELNPSMCWFNYNNTNTTVTCTDNNYSFITTTQKNLTFYANDTFGNLASNFTSWDYNILEINQTFNNETTEGNLESFSANIIVKDGLSLIATALIYNGTSNVGSNSVSEGITTLTISDVLIPSVEAHTNLSFFWSVILSDSTQINLSIQNQTVFDIGIDNCTSFTNQIFNFNSIDEELQTIIANTTKEIAINFFSADRSQIIFNLSDEYTSNPSLICLSINLTVGSNYSVDAIIKYEAENYAIEYYNIVDLLFTNNTPEQNITLFDLNISDSTDFQLTFTGQDFLPVENALVFVERQFISENSFKTVELPKTDSNGQTILHLVRNDIVYNIIVTKDGEVLGRFSNLIAFCDDFSIGDCKISLNAIGEESGVPNYDEELGILFSAPPQYNGTTNIVSFDFISEDGTTKVVTLNVERRDVFGNTSLCTNSVVSTSGTVFCDTGNITESSIVSIISVDGETAITSETLTDNEAYGSIGYVALFFLSLTLMVAFGDSKNGLMLAILIGFISAVGLGWVLGGIVGLGSSGILLIILAMTVLWQINKERGN